MEEKKPIQKQPGPAADLNPSGNKPDEVKESTVDLMFRENRKYDLHIGSKMLTFKGRVVLPVPKSWIEHPDFKPVEKLFIVINKKPDKKGA